MKTQTVFQNSSLVSVVNGSIVVKSAAGIEHTFTNASIVSVNNGTIIIESEWTPKRGELVKITGQCIDAYSIINKIEGNVIYVFGWKKTDSNNHYLENNTWLKGAQTKISPVTPEEQKEFDDFCKSQGKLWNKETSQWEKYKWQSKKDEKYYFLTDLGEVNYTKNDTLYLDFRRIEYGNCFQTEEQAQKASEKVKELLKSL